ILQASPVSSSLQSNAAVPNFVPCTKLLPEMGTEGVKERWPVSQQLTGVEFGVTFEALATDYDDTLAQFGRTDAPTLQALQRVKRSGRKLILVTGRLLPDLKRVFPEIAIFDLVVAENGALLYDPHGDQETVLAEPPPEDFVATLRNL